MSKANISERILEYLTFKNMTAKALEKLCNLGNGTIKKLSEKTRESTIDRIVSRCPDLNKAWLLTGEGEMLKAETEAPEDTPEISYTDGVPYYDEFFECGFDELVPSDTRNPDFLVRMPGYDKATMWCNASGASMEPEINNGDLIAMQLIQDISFLPYGDIYGIITTNGMRTIKRLGRSSQPGCYRLIPTNKDYDEQDLPIRLIAVVYRVLGALKTF